MMKMYKDDFGNMAKIEQRELLPYMGATKKETGYKLTCFSRYSIDEFDEVYYVSIYPTLGDAERKLKEFSSSTFKLCAIY